MLWNHKTQPPPHVSGLLLNIIQSIPWIFHGFKALLHVRRSAQAQVLILIRQISGTVCPYHAVVHNAARL